MWHQETLGFVWFFILHGTLFDLLSCTNTSAIQGQEDAVMCSCPVILQSISWKQLNINIHAGWRSWVESLREHQRPVLQRLDEDSRRWTPMIQSRDFRSKESFGIIRSWIRWNSLKYNWIRYNLIHLSLCQVPNLCQLCVNLFLYQILSPKQLKRIEKPSRSRSWRAGIESGILAFVKSNHGFVAREAD